VQFLKPKLITKYLTVVINPFELQIKFWTVAVSE